jgi:hypothetical protein
MGMNNGMDGLAYIAALYPNVFDYRVLAFGALEEVRNSEMFRFNVYVAPQGNLTIAARDSYITQIRAVPGAWLYAIRAFELEGINFSYRVFTEAGRDLDSGQFRFPRSGVDPALRTCGTLPYQPLFEPVCLTDGHVNVEICNLGTSTMTGQVLLIVAEPLPAINSVAGRYCSA